MPALAKNPSLRTIWLKVHLYLALIAGFFFALLGLTGSLSIYRETGDALLNPALQVTDPQTKMQSLDIILKAIKQAYPNRYGSWTLEMPMTPSGMITAWFDKPQETLFEFHAPLMVSINPYTAEVVNSRFWGQTFSTWLLDLHTQLQIDEFGWNMVGLLGVLLIFSIGSGLYLWWPGWRGLISSFLIRVNNGQKTLFFDLHRNIGLLIAGALFILAGTGINLSFPKILQAVTGSSGMAHGETGREIVSTADPTKRPTTLAGAVFVAHSIFPNAELRRISTPLGETGVYRINFRQNSEINHRHPYTTVWVDQWSGQIKAVRNPQSFSKGETISAWIWPLHTGEALGKMGRFLWFLAGLGLFFAYVSGLWLWLIRRGTLSDRPVNIAVCKAAIERLTIILNTGRKKLLQRLKHWLQHALETAPQLNTALQRYFPLKKRNDLQDWIYLRSLKIYRYLRQWLNNPK